MGKSQRIKGQVGEREIRNLIESYTGIRLKRNQNQSSDGGYDLIVDLSLLTSKEDKVRALTIDEWSIEVKNTEKGYQPAYWVQTLDQAERYERKPVLFYKVARKGWNCVVKLSDIVNNSMLNNDELAFISPASFFKLIGIYKQDE